MKRDEQATKEAREQHEAGVRTLDALFMFDRSKGRSTPQNIMAAMRVQLIRDALFARRGPGIAGRRDGGKGGGVRGKGGNWDNPNWAG